MYFKFRPDKVDIQCCVTISTNGNTSKVPIMDSVHLFINV